ncbi:ATP-binding cassette domain-containing protein [Phytohabitans flavus]|uniref:ABC transporter ATP-binding protein n=1 Tax=Phytohabitans flavus TaxID=1076124 RepID=A0A6F8XLX0_9ACTN|nr:ATP-binding cassette domain-containing protein [Phytohabitans flavus]BCB74805.1 ABC transporter ATP-binding protein [Phytohabitans flavus]
MNASLLEVRDVAKSYGAVTALKRASFSVRSGEVVALAGDNGAGKSTLIKILSGSISADSGEVRFAGEPVSIGSPNDAARLGIQTVYQDLALCDNLDVVDNIFLGREPRGPWWRGFRVRRPRMERLTADALASVGIRIQRVDVPMGHLSGGQRQCVAVCRAILGDPKVVILDEPTAALGVAQRREVLDLIVRLRDQGRGVILISHDLVDILKVADRIVVLRLGETVADKPGAEWTEHTLVSAITGATAGEQR